jgi:hypothetical protein
VVHRRSRAGHRSACAAAVIVRRSGRPRVLATSLADRMSTKSEAASGLTLGSGHAEHTPYMLAASRPRTIKASKGTRRCRLDGQPPWAARWSPRSPYPGPGAWLRRPTSRP